MSSLCTPVILLDIFVFQLIIMANKGVSFTQKKRSRQRKLRAYDLSALSEFLPDLDVFQQPSDVTKLKLNCKSRQKLVYNTIKL